ncbi:MAG: TetR/AcrR family transcriptional regulator [Candidatus Eremiobacteraeota bacterium]|nr:TetR/AcrR family transcriptional regulator [Candidatus Eremiobacteraeota bacterium]
MQGSKRRNAILASAAPIFNRRGFAGTSIAEILEATALEKGGLYNHFASKEELAIASFEYAWEAVNAHFKRCLAGVAPGAPALHAYVDAFARYVQRPVVDGGCPLANAALEADDALPFLRDRVKDAFGKVRSFVRHHVQRAIEFGEFAASTEPETVADFTLAALEGAFLLARGARSRRSMDRVAASLHAWLRTLEVPA